MKDFRVWHKNKTVLENSWYRNIYFHEREIWWCSVGLNVGDEQDGKNERFERPVLIIKKFNNKLVWILPMSSKVKFGPYYSILEFRGQKFSVLLSQLRVISVKRLLRVIRKISHQQFSEIREKTIRLF